MSTTLPRVAVTGEHRDLARHAHAVDHYSTDHRLPLDQAPRVSAEMLRYLHAGAQPSQPLPSPRAVDEAWHSFILHTRGYAEFCTERLGRFLHHVPTGLAESAPGSYAGSRAVLIDRYGELDPTVWPEAGGHCHDQANCKADCTGNCSPGG